MLKHLYACISRRISNSLLIKKITSYYYIRAFGPRQSQAPGDMVMWPASDLFCAPGSINKKEQENSPLNNCVPGSIYICQSECTPQIACSMLPRKFPIDFKIIYLRSTRIPSCFMLMWPVLHYLTRVANNTSPHKFKRV